MSKYISIVIIVICCSLSSLLYAQSSEKISATDSLQHVLRTAKDDTNKVNVFNALAYGYRNNNPDSGLYYGQQAIILAQKLNWKTGLAKAFNNTGNNYFSLADSSNAIANYKSALNIYQQLKNKDGTAQSLNYIGTVYLLLLSDYTLALPYHEKAFALFQQVNDKAGLAACCEDIAIAYESLGDYPKALQKFQQAANLDEQTHDEHALAINYSHMGIFYDDIKQYAKALDYCKKSLSIFKRLDNKTGIAHNLISIGNIYLDLNKCDDAINYYQQSVEINQELNDQSGMAKSIGNMGLAYATVLNYSKALKYYEQSLDINKQIGDKSGIAAVFGSIGYVYLNAPGFFLKKKGLTRNESYKKALRNLNSSLHLSKETGDLEIQQNALQELSNVYKKQKNYLQAYNTYKDFITIRDSILNDEKQKEITNREMQYAYDKKENALKAEQNEKNALAATEIKKQTFIRNYTLAGVGVAAVFAAFIIVSFNRRRKTKFDKQVMNVEMKALRAQMNPHFIFNSLHSINNYVMENDKQNASDYLLKFASLMRFILESSREQEVPVETDLEALELYMQLEALQSKQTFTYKIETDKCIDKANTLIPPMLLQPFVENAILHGIKYREDGFIKIKVHEENAMICFEIEDNGTGIKELTVNRQQNKKHKSLGRKIVDERLEIINRLHKAKASVQTFNLGSNDNTNGVKVKLLLPLKFAF